MTRSVAVIGGGFSGALVALNILAHPALQKGVVVTIIDPRGTFGPGLAYTVPSDRFKLNVRAQAMGAFPHDPAGFLQWLRSHGHNFGGEEFVSRRLYGLYLQDLVSGASASRGDALQLVQGEAVGIADLGAERGFSIRLADSSSIAADACIVAIGNVMRKGVGPRAGAPALLAPYDPGSYTGIRDCSTILIVGSSLTAVDVILECEGLGFSGHYSVVSRHGRFPLPHEDLSLLPAAELPPAWDTPGTARNLLKIVRRASRRCGSSQPVFIAMREGTQRMWQGLPMSEKRAFLRHVRPFWDIHRHRVPAEHLEAIHQLQAAGRLALFAGRVIQAKEGIAEVALRGSTATPTVLPFQRGFLCIGPEGDLSRSASPLVKDLIDSGLLKAGPLALGASPECSLREPRLFVVGPLQREALWESTAVQELRERAHHVAQRIAEALS